MATSFIVGAWTFSPIVYHVENNIFVSVAHAEIKTLIATDSAGMSFGDDNPQIVEMVKNQARQLAVQAAREKTGIYLKGCSKNISGVLTENDISVVASKVEIIDVTYKKSYYNEQDLKGQTTGKVGFKYEATVTVKADSDELLRYVKLDNQEKVTLIQQNNDFRKNIEKINNDFENFTKTAPNKNPQQIKSESKRINDEILVQQKLEEGYNHYYHGRWQAAINCYTEAIKINPKVAEAYKKRAEAYEKLEANSKKESKNYSDALKDFSMAISLNPNDAENYHKRGELYDFRLKNIAYALLDYDKALNLNPKLVMTYGRRASIYYNLKNYKLAIADFSRAIDAIDKIEKSELEKYLGIGIDVENNLYEFTKNQLLYELLDCRLDAYLDSKNYKKALDDCNRIINLGKKFGKVFYKRGICYQALGRTAEADIDFAKAKELGYNG